MTAPALQPRTPRPGPAWAPMIVAGLYDLAAAAAAMWAGVRIRYVLEDKPPPDLIVEQSSIVFAAACALVFFFHGLHRGVWRYTALNDAARIVRAVAIAHLVFFPVLFLINRLDGFPRTSVLIEIPLLLALLLGPRMALAAWRTRGLRAAFSVEDRSKPAAILVGEAGEMDEALRDLARQNGAAPFRVKGLIEPAGGHAGRSIRGAPVLGGLDALDRVLSRLKAAESEPPRIVLTDPQADPGLVNRLIEIAGRHGARLSRSRPGKGAQAFSPVEAADMLNRTPRAPDLGPARPLIAGKRVLVTGAGGTIGSQLARLAAALGPDRLILFDSSEANLYEIDLEFAHHHAGLNWRAALGDVRDKDRLAKVFAEEKPQIVLHAAALKHVPLMEVNPAEAVRTNVTGTRNVIAAARTAGSDIVAVISTDKAVAPSNVMGATKRAAELLAGLEAQSDGPTRICTVRFGNVLGSNGSVAPLFERQIEEGRPVTVTDPGVTRYFMTVEEASGLVLSAAAQTAADPDRNGALYVLDMGEPVSILHLAKQLIRLRGKDPEAPEAISIIGLRPGEKLHEALTWPFETQTPTDADSIRLITGRRPEAEDIRAALQTLEAAGAACDAEAARQALETICALAPRS